MSSEQAFTFTPVYRPPVVETRWQRFKRWLLRRPKPLPPQPEGTVPLVFDVNDNGRQVRYFIPAARISPAASEGEQQ